MSSQNASGIRGEKHQSEPGTEELAAASPPPEKATRSITGIRWALVVCGVLSVTFLFSLDNSIVADVQPKIIDTFGEIDKLPWLSVAYALGSAATCLVWASVYSSFNAKHSYCVAVFLFEVGSAICGAANSMDLEIFGRALAGLGGIGAYVGVLSLLSALTTPAERPLYIGAIGILWGLGSVLGPVIGGAFTESDASWRWSFYINLVVAGVFVPVYLFLIPSVNPQPDRPTMDKIKKMDYVGSFLITAAYCFGITGLSMGGSLFTWDSATTIVLLVLSPICLIFFVIQQALCLFTTLEQRILPLHYFKDRTLGLLFFLSFAGAPPVVVPVYFLSLFFQFAKGDSALDAAVKLLPFIAMCVVFAMLNGGVMGKEGHYAPWFLIASPVVLTGSTLMYTVDEHSSTSAVYGYSALLGMGAGSLIQICFVVAQAIVPRVEMPRSVSYISLGQTTGMAVGLTVTNTIFLNLAQVYIKNALPNADPNQINAAISGFGSSFLTDLPQEAQAAVIHAIISAISKTYIFLIVVAGVEFLASFFLKWERVFLEM